MRTPVARSTDDLLRYLVDRLAAQGGGGGSSSGFVFVRPIDGTSDDWPTFATVTTANAYKNILVMLPGKAGQTFQALTSIPGCPASGTTIIGTPGTIIECGMNPADPTSAPFRFTSGGVALTQSADVLAGAHTIELAQAGLNGQRILLLTAVGQAGSQYILSGQTGMGPFTYQLDRSTYIAFPMASSTVTTVVGASQDISVDGNDMVVRSKNLAAQGAGCFINYSVGWNLLFQNILFQGEVSGFICLYDTASVYCYARRLLAITTISASGLCFASCESCAAEDCVMNNCTSSTGAYSMQGGSDLELIRCNSANATSFGLFGVPNTAAGPLIALRCEGCAFNDSGQYGVLLSGCYDVVLDSCITWGTSSGGAIGVVLSGGEGLCVGTRIINHSAQYNETGIATGTPTDAIGTVIVGANCPNNSFNGLSIQNDVDITGFTCLQDNNQLTAGHSAIVISGAGANVRMKGLRIQSSVDSTPPYIAIQHQAGKLYAKQGHITLDQAATYPLGMQQQGVSLAVFDDLTIDGAHMTTQIIGLSTVAATSILRLTEPNFDGLALPLDCTAGTTGLGNSGGITEIATTGGTTNLTLSQCANGVLEVTGVLASNAIIGIFNGGLSGVKLDVANLTTGGFTVEVEVVGGSGSNITQGKRCTGYSDNAAAWQWASTER